MIGREIFAVGAFDFTKFELVLSLLPKQHTKKMIVDVGANIGSICIPAIKRGHFIHAMAIEPDPLNFRLLQVNSILNSLENSINLHNVALGTEKGVATLELSKDNLGDHRIRTGEKKDGELGEASRDTIQVQINTLDEICAEANAIDCLIWMDTQGYEGHVIQGGSMCLSKRIPLVLEFWPYAIQRCDSYEPLKSGLLRAGYSTLIDLDDPAVKLPLSSENLDKLYRKLEKRNSSTDIFVQ